MGRIEDIVLGIVSSVAPDSDIRGVKYDVPLREQLDLDSMDFLDIVMELRKNYGVEVPKEDYEHLSTLKSCAEYLGPKIKSN